ncbi:hypothetical protein GWK47_030433 [Chionoecetes opilio]|uniref:Uncharacterized protein n=1 Tax=Chionoecetes opilio TaxID=41210 RepID=A0A8J4YJN8_CHIOP|nr:hypothetical protein GWK47_030433 [Chionoecetes opilio]
MILAPLGPDVVFQPSYPSTHRLANHTVFSPFESIFGRVAPFSADRHIPVTERTLRLPPWANTFRAPWADSGGTARCAASTPPPSPAAIEPFLSWDAPFLVTTPPYLRSSQASPEMDGPFTVVRISKCLPGRYATDAGDRTAHGADAKPYTEPPDPPPPVLRHPPFQGCLVRT